MAISRHTTVRRRPDSSARAANPTHGRMLTAAQAAERLGVKLATVYAYVSRGWLRSYRRRVGRRALYRRADVDALRRVVSAERGRRGRNLPEASSWVTVAHPRTFQTPAPGVIVAESAISSIIQDHLAYRGYPIEELVEHATFEEVCILLWEGERPRADTAARFGEETAAQEIPPGVSSVLEAVGRNAPPVVRLQAVMPALAAFSRRHGPHSQPERARQIIGIMPPALGHHPAQATRPAHGVAERLLRAGVGPSAARWEVEALNRILIACAEHELNASTFAARVVASTGADLYASVLAALCSLSGPIHGGACDRIEVMFARLMAGMPIGTCLDEFVGDRGLVPGFGHAIYPAGDPRAVLLREVARTISRHRGRRLFETAMEVEREVRRRDRLRPNLDFYLTVSTRMLGFAPGLPAAIFAVGRTAGWIAHILEQYADNRLLRPRMRYRGAPVRHWDSS